MEIRKKQINHLRVSLEERVPGKCQEKYQVKDGIEECVYIVCERQRSARCLVKSTEIERSFLWSVRKSIAPFQYVNLIQPPGTLESFL